MKKILYMIVGVTFASQAFAAGGAPQDMRERNEFMERTSVALGRTWTAAESQEFSDTKGSRLPEDIKTSLTEDQIREFCQGLHFVKAEILLGTS